MAQSRTRPTRRPRSSMAASASWNSRRAKPQSGGPRRSLKPAAARRNSANSCTTPKADRRGRSGSSGHVALLRPTAHHAPAAAERGCSAAGSSVVILSGRRGFGRRLPFCTWEANMQATLIAVVFAAGAGPADPPKGRAPTEVVGVIGCDDAVRVLNLLGGAGIPATADGPFVYYAVKVPPKEARRARALLRMNAAGWVFWLEVDPKR